LDVEALPPPDHRVRPAAAALGSGTPLERGIAGIWADVLQIPEPDLDQNFFDVGGNSLHVAQVHVRLQKFLDRTFSITELFAHSTIRALAAHFSSGSRIGAATASRTRAQRQRETVLAHRNVRIERK
jgi:acyl carrier protein